MKVRYLQFAIDSADQALAAGECIRYTIQNARSAEALLASDYNSAIGLLAWNIDFESEQAGMVVTVHYQSDAIFVDIFNASDAEITLQAATLRAAVIPIPPKAANDGTSNAGVIVGPFTPVV